MALADIFLPAATFAEKESFRSWWVPLGIMQKTIQVGECRSDWEINIELANRLNPNCKYKNVKLEDVCWLSPCPNLPSHIRCDRILTNR